MFGGNKHDSSAARDRLLKNAQGSAKQAATFQESECQDSNDCKVHRTASARRDLMIKSNCINAEAENGLR